MTDNIEGVATFALGGVQRRVKVTLALAPAIEEATGRGAVRLMRDAASGDMRITDACEILRAAMVSAGVKYTREDVLALMEHEGAAKALGAATNVLAQLFRVPESAPRGKGKPAKSETATP